MNYDDWLFEQDWSAATSGSYMPTETGLGGSYNDYLFDMDWNLATSGQAMTNEVIQSIGFAVDVSQPYIQAVAKVAGVSPVIAEDATTKAARAGTTAESANKSDNKTGTGSAVMDKLKAVSGWMDQNKELTKVLAGAVGGAAQARERRKLTAAQSTSAKEQIELADRLKQEANQRYSDSVKGLRTPTGGLINSPLVRKSGQRVFDNNGNVVRG